MSANIGENGFSVQQGNQPYLEMNKNVSHTCFASNSKLDMYIKNLLEAWTFDYEENYEWVEELHEEDDNLLDWSDAFEQQLLDMLKYQNDDWDRKLMEDEKLNDEETLSILTYLRNKFPLKGKTDSQFAEHMNLT